MRTPFLSRKTPVVQVMEDLAALISCRRVMVSRDEDDLLATMSCDVAAVMSRYFPNVDCDEFIAACSARAVPQTVAAAAAVFAA